MKPINNMLHSEGDILEGAPIIVLINEGSASAAEISPVHCKIIERAQLVGARSWQRLGAISYSHWRWSNGT